MAKAKVNFYTSAYPPKSENAIIEVYRTKAPSKEYTEFAEIYCNDTNEEWALNQILIKAREIGADAIIIIGPAEVYGVGVPIGNMVYTSSSEYGLRSIAIKYAVN